MSGEVGFGSHARPDDQIDWTPKADEPIFVDIVDVIPDTMKVRADELQLGDIQFSVFGQQLEPITRLGVLRSGRVSVSRGGDGRGGSDWYAPYDTVTVHRPTKVCTECGRPATADTYCGYADGGEGEPYEHTTKD